MVIKFEVDTSSGVDVGAISRRAGGGGGGGQTDGTTIPLRAEG